MFQSHLHFPPFINSWIVQWETIQLRTCCIQECLWLYSISTHLADQPTVWYCLPSAIPHLSNNSHRSQELSGNGHMVIWSTWGTKGLAGRMDEWMNKLMPLSLHKELCCGAPKRFHLTIHTCAHTHPYAYIHKNKNIKNNNEKHTEQKALLGKHRKEGTPLPTWWGHQHYEHQLCWVHKLLCETCIIPINKARQSSHLFTRRK